MKQHAGVCVCVTFYHTLQLHCSPDWATIISAQITGEPSVLLASLLLHTEGARGILLEQVRSCHSFSL